MVGFWTSSESVDIHDTALDVCTSGHGAANDNDGKRRSLSVDEETFGLATASRYFRSLSETAQATAVVVTWTTQRIRLKLNVTIM